MAAPFWPNLLLRLAFRPGQKALEHVTARALQVTHKMKSRRKPRLSVNHFMRYLAC